MHVREHNGIRFDLGAITENQAICFQLLDFKALFNLYTTVNVTKAGGKECAHQPLFCHL